MELTLGGGPPIDVRVTDQKGQDTTIAGASKLVASVGFTTPPDQDPRREELRAECMREIESQKEGGLLTEAEFQTLQQRTSKSVSPAECLMRLLAFYKIQSEEWEAFTKIVPQGENIPEEIRNKIKDNNASDYSLRMYAGRMRREYPLEVVSAVESPLQELFRLAGRLIDEGIIAGKNFEREFSRGAFDKPDTLDRRRDIYRLKVAALDEVYAANLDPERTDELKKRITQAFGKATHIRNQLAKIRSSFMTEVSTGADGESADRTEPHAATVPAAAPEEEFLPGEGEAARIVEEERATAEGTKPEAEPKEQKVAAPGYELLHQALSEGLFKNHGEGRLYFRLMANYHAVQDDAAAEQAMREKIEKLLGRWRALKQEIAESGTNYNLDHVPHELDRRYRLSMEPQDESQKGKYHERARRGWNKGDDFLEKVGEFLSVKEEMQARMKENKPKWREALAKGFDDSRHPLKGKPEWAEKKQEWLTRFDETVKSPRTWYKIRREFERKARYRLGEGDENSSQKNASASSQGKTEEPQPDTQQQAETAAPNVDPSPADEGRNADAAAQNETAREATGTSEAPPAPEVEEVSPGGEGVVEDDTVEDPSQQANPAREPSPWYTELTGKHEIGNGVKLYRDGERVFLAVESVNSGMIEFELARDSFEGKNQAELLAHLQARCEESKAELGVSNPLRAPFIAEMCDVAEVRKLQGYRAEGVSLPRVRLTADYEIDNVTFTNSLVSFTASTPGTIRNLTLQGGVAELNLPQAKFVNFVAGKDSVIRGNSKSASFVNENGGKYRVEAYAVQWDLRGATFEGAPKRQLKGMVFSYDLVDSGVFTNISKKLEAAKHREIQVALNQSFFSAAPTYMSVIARSFAADKPQAAFFPPGAENKPYEGKFEFPSSGEALEEGKSVIPVVEFTIPRNGEQPAEISWFGKVGRVVNGTLTEAEKDLHQIPNVKKETYTLFSDMLFASLRMSEEEYRRKVKAGMEDLARSLLSDAERRAAEEEVDPEFDGIAQVVDVEEEHPAAV